MSFCKKYNIYVTLGNKVRNNLSLLIAVICLCVVSSCGFTPLNRNNTSKDGIPESIYIRSVNGNSSELLRNLLRKRFLTVPNANTIYQCDITIDEKKSAVRKMLMSDTYTSDTYTVDTIVSVTCTDMRDNKVALQESLSIKTPVKIVSSGYYSEANYISSKKDTIRKASEILTEKILLFQLHQVSLEQE